MANLSFFFNPLLLNLLIDPLGCKTSQPKFGRISGRTEMEGIKEGSPACMKLKCFNTWKNKKYTGNGEFNNNRGKWPLFTSCFFYPEQNISEPNHSQKQEYIWRIFVMRSCFLTYNVDFQEDKKEVVIRCLLININFPKHCVREFWKREKTKQRLFRRY